MTIQEKYRALVNATLHKHLALNKFGLMPFSAWNLCMDSKTIIFFLVVTKLVENSSLSYKEYSQHEQNRPGCLNLV